MWRFALLCRGLVGLVAATDSGTAEANSGKKANSDDESSAPDYQQFIPNYTQYIPNYTQYFNASWEQYVPKYEQYAHVNKYINFAKSMQHNHAPASAQNCNTTAQLDAWRKKEEAPIRAFVPEAFRQFSIDPIEEKYEKNLKRIKEAQRLHDDNIDGAALKTTGTFLAAKFGDYSSKNVVHAGSSSDTKSQRSTPDKTQYIPDYKHYIPDYKQYIPAKYNKSIPDNEKLIPDYEKYMDIQKYKDYADASGNVHVESHPSRCKTMECVDNWRKHQEGNIRTFVPKAFQSFSMDAIEEEYAANVKRIETSEKTTNNTGVAAVTLAADWEQYVPKYAKYQDVQKWMKFGKSMQLQAKSASTCKTKQELDAWKKMRETPLLKYVPKEYQTRSLKSIDAEYKENLKRIKESQKEAANETAAKVAEEKSRKSTESGASAAVVEDLVPSYAKHADVEMFLSFASFIQQQHVPEKVDDCKNMTQLKSWYDKEQAIIKEFVPPAYQAFPTSALEKKYEEHKRRIEASQEGVSLTLASLPNYVSSLLLALAAIMFSVALVVSLSRHFRRASSLEEALLEAQATCAV